MKDEVPEGWMVCSIEEVTVPVEKVLPGSAPDKPFKYLDISGIDNRRNVILEAKEYFGRNAPSRARQLVRVHDVLFSTVRTYLKNIAPVPKHFDSEIASTGFSVLRASATLDHRYLFYYTLTHRFLNPLADLQRGSSYPAVREQDVRCQLIPLPPLNEQKRIVARIDELFSELEAAEASFKQAWKQLGAYRQSLLKRAFEGKLTERWRSENADKLESADELLERIRKEREARYQQQLADWQAAVKEWEGWGKKGKKPVKPRAAKPSQPVTVDEVAELPRLPEGWIQARLGEVIDGIDAGKSFACDERIPSDGEVGVAKVSAVTWGEYNEHESKTCRDKSKENPEYLIREGDFLLSRANTIDLVGACVIAKNVTKPIMLSDKTLRIRFSEIHREFILLYLRSRIGRLEIMKRSTGNQESMRNIGQDRVSAIIFPLCSLPEQNEIVRILDEQFEAIEQNEKEIDAALKKIEALRQSILKKAFSGKLVTQDPDDEPARVLLERIQEEERSTEETRGGNRTKGRPKVASKPAGAVR